MMDLVCIGEAMGELRQTEAGCEMAFAGDTFNTAIYTRRLVENKASVGFLTRIGQDPMSDGLLSLAAKEDVVMIHDQRDAERNLGLYAITTDPSGERSFHYWRSQSAARQLFSDEGDTEFLLGADILYLSGISIAILPQAARDALFAALVAHREAGGRVGFDSNYRPKLWEDQSAAQRETQRFWQIADICLPSVDDEMALFGDASPDRVLARLQSWSCIKGAMKCGPDGPTSLRPDAPRPLYPRASNVVDTTAAGDSFNGGYLAGLLMGQNEEERLQLAHRTALSVIAHPGAIIPKQGLST